MPGINAAPLFFIERLPVRQFLQAGDHHGGIGVGNSAPAVESPIDVAQSVRRTEIQKVEKEGGGPRPAGKSSCEGNEYARSLIDRAGVMEWGCTGPGRPGHAARDARDPTGP
ncbi:hypothetical protein AB0M87_30630 [Streptomyces sp. NPDC051320]|uniref:hypothetical protein n=1 Tax=Streptomyces sp. NPDC051320 TaxID=3154644 RepID=UPI00344A281D